MKLAIPTLVATLALAGCAMTLPTEGQEPAAPAASDAAAAVAAAGPACDNLSGTIAELLTSANTAAGTIAGNLNGAASIVITQLTESGSGARHFVANHTIVTAIGDTLFTTDRGVMVPTKPPVYQISNQLTISRGTGIYADASGRLHTTGDVNFATGSVRLEYRGRLCR